MKCFSLKGLLLLVLVEEVACGCDAVGCTDGYRLLLEFDGQMPSESYVLTVELDDDVYTATCDLSESYGDCEFELVSGEGLYSVDFDVWDLNVSGTPSVVALDVSLRDETLFTDTWEPTYATERPTPNACDACTHAADTATVRAP